MQEVKYFYLKNCPHCKNADHIIEELIEETPAYAAVKLNKIEEREQAALADAHDYYYVPCLYIGDQKLHEGVPTKDKIRKVLQKALEDN